MSNQKIGTVEAIMMILAIVVSHTLLYLPKNILSFMKSASILNIIYVSIFAILIASTKHFANFSIAASFIYQRDTKDLLSIFTIVPAYSTFPESVPIFFNNKQELLGLSGFSSLPATTFKYGTGSKTVLSECNHSGLSAVLCRYEAPSPCS